MTIKFKNLTCLALPLYVANFEVAASPMTRGEYNSEQGWDIPEDENPNDDGYVIIYSRHTSDEYISWLPKDLFKERFEPLNAEPLTESSLFDYGEALKQLKKGKRLSRTGWNANGMYVVLMDGYPNGVAANKETAKKHGLNEGDTIRIRPYFALKTAQDDISTWAASVSDQLANDWFIFE